MLSLSTFLDSYRALFVPLKHTSPCSTHHELMPCRLSQPQPCDIKPKTTLATAFGRLSNWLGWRNKSSTPRSAQATVVCIYTLMRPRSPRTPTAGSLRLPKQCLFFLFLPARYTVSPDPICGCWDIMRPGRPKHQHTKCSCLGRRCKRPPGR